MRIIYVAGFHRDVNELQVEIALAATETVARRVRAMGVATHYSHINIPGGSGLDQEVWEKLDRAMLARCDAVVCVEGWRGSPASVRDVDEAIARGLPVFTDLEDLASWLNSPVPARCDPAA